MVRDYEKDRVLWSQTVTKGRPVKLKVTPTGSFLIVNTELPDGHTLTVLRLPIPLSSPWWPRAAGLLVAGLVLGVGRRRVGLPAV